MPGHILCYEIIIIIQYVLQFTQRVYCIETLLHLFVTYLAQVKTVLGVVATVAKVSNIFYFVKCTT